MATTQPLDSSSAPSSVHGRFNPGTNLGERYRIVGLLGCGGMGEVYRADDLELGQSVALKFLPEKLAADPVALDRFRNEVRTARHVAHPNVCRMYDIAQVDGHVFLSMEYIDGEDLAHVLRRMGRPSNEKAVEIARQLCLGLAAAHENGVLHRDLKPANIMIDGRGGVRITDFGLAGLADELGDREERAGTPAYMAPEQLSSGAVSIRSDIYALGLILHEIFTGQKVFDTNNVAELKQQHQTGTISMPSSGTDQIDPAVERVIGRCLEHDPQRRPSSVYAVLGALPGGDPLAAALAAGETPSPELLANAGETGGLSTRAALAWLIAGVVGIVLCVILSGERLLIRAAPPPFPPQALAFKARELADKLGYEQQPRDRAYGFTSATDLLDSIKQRNKSPDRWDQLATLEPHPVLFWYRESPRDLAAVGVFTRIDLSHPALDVSGMVNIVLDAAGRLVEFAAVPPQLDEDEAPADAVDVDWSVVFEAADLQLSDFKTTAPHWTPPVFADKRSAWEAASPADQTARPLRIEAASYGGKPVYFQRISSWTRPGRMEASERKITELIGNLIGLSLLLTLMGGGLLLAVRNLRLRRGDREGALRLAVSVLVLGQLIWTLSEHHVPSFVELGNFIGGLGFSLFVAGFVWVMYVALEPYVRRGWAHALVSWSRLLRGRFRDPLVGRDLLIGAICGVLIALVGTLRWAAPPWFWQAPDAPGGFNFQEIRGARFLAAEMAGDLVESVFFGLAMFFLLFLLRAALRNRWLAATAFVLIFGVVGFLQAEGGGWIAPAIGLLVPALFVFVMSRHGLLAMAATMLVSRLLLDMPMPTDLSSWHLGAGLVTLLAVVAPMAYGFYVSLAGRPLLRDELLET